MDMSMTFISKYITMDVKKTDSLVTKNNVISIVLSHNLSILSSLSIPVEEILTNDIERKLEHYYRISYIITEWIGTQNVPVYSKKKDAKTFFFFF